MTTQMVNSNPGGHHVNITESDQSEWKHRLFHVFTKCSPFVCFVVLQIIKALTLGNLPFAYVNNKDVDQPAHLHSLNSTFFVCCLNSVKTTVSLSEILSVQLVFLIMWTHLSHNMFKRN